MEKQAAHSSGAYQSGSRHYIRLAVMLVLSFVAMFILMYAMVDRFANVYSNFNQFYMAGLMTAAMVVIELLVMGGMYPNKRLNLMLVIVGLLALAAFWMFTRKQTAIEDRQFIKSMIPHHSGAILMCTQSELSDPALQKLCSEIVKGQQKEIDDMKAILQRLDQ
jgi:FlaA1/EpsC-like NDP-sugar epimerase